VRQDLASHVTTILTFEVLALVEMAMRSQPGAGHHRDVSSSSAKERSCMEW